MFSYLFRRPTSVFKRVGTEGRQPTKKPQDPAVYKNEAYQYHEFDQLDYPHYVPRELIFSAAVTYTLPALHIVTLHQIHIQCMLHIILCMHVIL